MPWLLLLLSQVIMPNDEDVLFKNATSKPMNVILVSTVCLLCLKHYTAVLADTRSRARHKDASTTTD
jgi:hypothetical protein